MSCWWLRDRLIHWSIHREFARLVFPQRTPETHLDRAVQSFIEVVRLVFGTAARKQLGVWVAAQFAKSSDVEVNQECSRKKLLQYTIVNNMLSRVSMNGGHMCEPFARVTGREALVQMNAWMMETAYQDILIDMATEYVNKNGLAVLLFFSRNVKGPSRASVITPGHILTGMGARAAVTFGLLSGPITHTAVFDEEGLAARERRMARMSSKWACFAQSREDMAKVSSDIHQLDFG